MGRGHSFGAGPSLPANCSTTSCGGFSLTSRCLHGHPLLFGALVNSGIRTAGSPASVIFALRRCCCRYLSLGVFGIFRCLSLCGLAALLYIYIYICIYIYIHMYTYVYICIYISTHAYTYIYIYIYTYIHLHIYIYIYMHTYTYTYIHTHIDVFVYICI